MVGMKERAKECSLRGSDHQWDVIFKPWTVLWNPVPWLCITLVLSKCACSSPIIMAHPVQQPHSTWQLEWDIHPHRAS
jgi:hypothetical protein